MKVGKRMLVKEWSREAEESWNEIEKVAENRRRLKVCEEKIDTK